MAYDASTGTLTPSSQKSLSSATTFLGEVDGLAGLGIQAGPSTTSKKGSSKMPGIIKRAVSSPNVRTLPSSESMSLSPADKKRNKLGYHRTAVACGRCIPLSEHCHNILTKLGHCRRRKIRCIPAFDDTSGKCQNCIRLKKECMFYPVDQQSPVPIKKSKSKGEGTNDPETSVSSSSPNVLGSSIGDPGDPMNGQMNTPPLPEGSPSLQSFNLSGGSVRHPGNTQVSSSLEDGKRQWLNSIAFPHGHYDFQPSYEHQGQSTSQFLPQTPSHFVADATQFHQPYFPPEQPLQHSYSTSSYTTSPLSSSMTTGSHENLYHFHHSNVHPGVNWDQNTLSRSMTIPDTGEYEHHFNPIMRTHTFPTFERSLTLDSETSPNSLVDARMMPITTQSPMTPTAFHPDPGSFHSMNTPIQSNWSSGPINQLPHSAAEGFPPNWFSMPTLSDVKEEDSLQNQSSRNPKMQGHREKPG